MTKPQTALARLIVILALVIIWAQLAVYQHRIDYNAGFDAGYSAGIEANQN